MLEINGPATTDVSTELTFEQKLDGLVQKICAFQKASDVAEEKGERDSALSKANNLVRLELQPLLPQMEELAPLSHLCARFRANALAYRLVGERLNEVFLDNISGKEVEPDTLIEWYYLMPSDRSSVALPYLGAMAASIECQKELARISAKTKPETEPFFVIGRRARQLELQAEQAARSI